MSVALPISGQDALRAVAQLYDEPVEAIVGPRRTSRLVEARDCASILLLEMGLSANEVAEMVCTSRGGRDRHRAADRLADEVFAWRVEVARMLALCNARRRVEALLDRPLPPPPVRGFPTVAARRLRIVAATAGE